MSKGLGWVQQAVLDLFTHEDAKFSTEEVASIVFQESPARTASLSSTRRALLKLVADGKLFDRGRRFMCRDRRWSTQKIEPFSEEWKKPNE